MPATNYARTADGDSVAYQVVGDGPRDLVFATSFVSHLEVIWERPSAVHFFERLASFSRLLLFDKRGVGMSDATRGAPTMEDRLENVRAVLNAVESERAVLFGTSEGAGTAAMFAASHPERSSALVMYAPAITVAQDLESPWGWPPEMIEFILAPFEEAFTTGLGIELINPSLAGDELAAKWYARFWRLSASPRAARDMMEVNAAIDIRPILPSIHVPTLVVHRRNETWVGPEHGRYAAARIPGATLVEIDGTDHYPWEQNTDVLVDEIEEFVTGERPGFEPDRVRATVLFTDIVSSTAHLARLGDHRWSELLDAHDRMTGEAIDRFRGRLIKSTGDGLVATFDGPARAIRCARAIAESVGGLGITVRAGVHTGEVENRGDDLAGIAVHLAQRVCNEACDGGVFVSRTVVDLVAGSGLAFAERGDFVLKGVPGTWTLFQAVR